MLGMLRRLIYYVATSVDGFIAHPCGTWEGFVTEGEHATDYLDELRTYSAVVMGRATWEIAPKMGVPDPYPYLETFVFSRTLHSVEHPNVRLIREDAVSYIAAMKGKPSDRGSIAPIYLAGGGAFAASMLAAHLVDEVVIKLNPFFMGQGIPVSGILPQIVPLRLRQVKDYGNNVVLLRYETRSEPLS